jgi:hypothetical protein
MSTPPATFNIVFVDEPEQDLLTRKNLFVDPDSELSLVLSRLQDNVEADCGITIDRSRYKYVKGKLCKFNIELLNYPDITTLIKRSASMKKLVLNLAKAKWDFSLTGQTYILKIGKIQDKDLFVSVFNAVESVSEEQKNKVRDIKDWIIKGKPIPVPVVEIEDEVVQEPDQEDEPRVTGEKTSEPMDVTSPVIQKTVSFSEEIPVIDWTIPMTRSPLQSPLPVARVADIPKPVMRRVLTRHPSTHPSIVPPVVISNPVMKPKIGTFNAIPKLPPPGLKPTIKRLVTAPIPTATPAPSPIHTPRTPLGFKIRG